MNRFFCFFLSCLLCYTCFMSITTINHKVDTDNKQYIVTTLQFIDGCTMDEERYIKETARIESEAIKIKDAKELEKFYTNNSGATVIYELKQLNQNNEEFDKKLLFLFVALIAQMFLVVNMLVFATICLFLKRFAKVNILMCSLTLISSIITAIASVSWLLTTANYTISFGVASIFFVLYSVLQLVFYASIVKKEL